MKTKSLWMFAAILICGAMTMLLGCGISDNVVVPPVEPNGPQEYVIEVEEGMTMPENEFLNVPATTDCDQNVINTLKAIDRVTDVKAFKLNERKDYYNEKIITKTAYYFNYKQDIDHNDPSKGWFKQQCVLTVAGQDRPTVLHTEGYALERDKNELQVIGEPMLAYVLDANCLQVEYRYNGWSLPEGYTNKWNYLTAKQQSDDLHAIVTAIKQSGVVGKNSKWLSTGVSKNGETTAHYAYHYPNEMDAYVPFCAPFLLDLADRRPYSHILTVQAFDEDQERMDKVKAAFRTYVSDKNLQAECVQLFKQDFPSYASEADEDVRTSLLTFLFGCYYAKMSYVAYKRWEDMIPKAGDPAEKFYDFIIADDYTQYPGETDEQYYRRRDYADDFEPESNNKSMSSALTRAAEVIRHDPYHVQVCIELGDYDMILDWADDLLTENEKKMLSFNTNPANFGVTYDKGKFVREFLEGMKQSTCNMMFVYSMQDPWTGGQIPDDKLGVNSRKLFIQQPYSYSEAGLHNDAIDQWNQSEKAELFKWLDNLGFDFGK